eukprot:CAMPEP_0184495972 /NCGR_PEP_ID=MMETSP0113_2-20130426/32809_1 /TAXON_ID=91329 /ORGANISM="Norrisiella sphaerica, Strain BC52" /LENGTH=65 /DNA_ID=CAMNT_0026882407 /DNA_START=746 /DNA_END=940 /DNA_ORIENTATION=+
MAAQLSTTAQEAVIDTIPASVPFKQKLKSKYFLTSLEYKLVTQQEVTAPKVVFTAVFPATPIFSP